MSQRSAESIQRLVAAPFDTGRREMTAASIRILVVSHVRLYREALAERLAQNGTLAILGTADHENALFEIERLKPDLLLLDMGEWHALDLALSGFLAQAVGWKAFYSITMFAAVPAMVIMVRILRCYPPAERQVP